MPPTTSDHHFLWAVESAKKKQLVEAFLKLPNQKYVPVADKQTIKTPDELAKEEKKLNYKKKGSTNKQPPPPTIKSAPVGASTYAPPALAAPPAQRETPADIEMISAPPLFNDILAASLAETSAVFNAADLTPDQYDNFTKTIQHALTTINYLPSTAKPAMEKALLTKVLETRENLIKNLTTNITSSVKIPEVTRMVESHYGGSDDDDDEYDGDDDDDAMSINYTIPYRDDELIIPIAQPKNPHPIPTTTTTTTTNAPQKTPQLPTTATIPINPKLAPTPITPKPIKPKPLPAIKNEPKFAPLAIKPKVSRRFNPYAKIIRPTQSELDGDDLETVRHRLKLQLLKAKFLDGLKALRNRDMLDAIPQFKLAYEIAVKREFDNHHNTERDNLATVPYIPPPVSPPSNREPIITLPNSDDDDDEGPAAAAAAAAESNALESSETAAPPEKILDSENEEPEEEVTASEKPLSSSIAQLSADNYNRETETVYNDDGNVIKKITLESIPVTLLDDPTQQEPLITKMANNFTAPPTIRTKRPLIEDYDSDSDDDITNKKFIVNRETDDWPDLDNPDNAIAAAKELIEADNAMELSRAITSLGKRHLPVIDELIHSQPKLAVEHYTPNETDVSYDDPIINVRDSDSDDDNDDPYLSAVE